MKTFSIRVGRLAEVPYIDKQFDDEIYNLLSVTNPEWIENHKMDRWQGNTPKQLKFFETFKEDPTRLFVPRGTVEEIASLMDSRGIKFEIINETDTIQPMPFRFQATLKPFQAPAVQEMLQHNIGTLCAPTGSGKTVMGLYIIKERLTPALIIVHTKELLYQWADRIEEFLGIPKRRIGIIGDGKSMVGEKITVALIQTLRKFRRDDIERMGIGQMIVDECHRTPSSTFSETIKRFPCHYILGLSATPYRRDGLTKLIFWYAGPKRYEIKPQHLIQDGDLAGIDVKVRRTLFIPSMTDPSSQYTTMLSEMSVNEERNMMIIDDVMEAYKTGETCLVLSDRKKHCEILKLMLYSQASFDGRAEVLTSDTEGRDKIVEDINNGKINVVIATSQLIGEGFDCKKLSALFLTMPIRAKARVTQYIGRVLRPDEKKEKAKIYDYFDEGVRCLYGAFKTRRSVYKQLQGG